MTRSKQFGFGRLFRSSATILSAWLLAASAPVQAQASGDAGFDTYVQSLWPKAQARGVSRATFDSVTAGLRYNARVVALDRDNLGIPPTPDTPIPAFAPYKAKHVDAARINGGRRVHDRLLPLLSRIEQRTGVPTSIMIAIFGHETAYGAVTGNFDLPEALATLAYEGRRRSLFEPEFLATLEMVEKGVPRSVLKGSWAGAFGYPQFLPSVYLQVAEDGDGDGVARIWSSEADAVESIGAYLRRAGWRQGEPWGVAVRVPDGFDRVRFSTRLQPTRCPRVFARYSRWRSMAEWRADGFQPIGGRWPDGAIQATLLEPDGPGKTAYLLTGNYRAILDYNCSNFYALSVGLLADEIDR
ncbi:lytic murein transglycosylase [Sphingopyxis granuli]|uniref:Lytic murein transglycosylase n=1 Tax=Sphingopyxis granuli TaxID=267128 RepID=A0AA86L2Z3_9SPHN|nr:lytic murein transglycosylase [Sphingopyxis granuli]AMG74589.1 Lytic murein transglycosylase [Sphingopyxis granuli]